MQKQYAFVVPAYNEAHRFDLSYFKEIRRLQTDIVFIFVNDGSSDDTLQVLENAAIEIPGSHVLSLRRNHGKSNAVREGLIFCEETFRELDWMGILDSDGSFSVKDVVSLVEHLPTFPISISAIFTKRFNYATSKNFQGLLRVVARVAISRILSFGWGRAPAGMQSGLKIFRNTPSFKRAIGSDFRTRWFMEWELLIRLTEAGEYQEISEFHLTEVSHKDNGHINSSLLVHVLLEVFEIKRQQLASKIRRFRNLYLVNFK
jgi:glycosyltransferase involved in cell wall biosynthesis